MPFPCYNELSFLLSEIDMSINETAQIQLIIQNYAHQTTNLLPILQSVQDSYSYISNTAIDCIANELNMPRAQVAGIAGFYSFYYDQPRGQYNVLFSDNIIEHYAGKQSLMDTMMQKLGVTKGQCRADNRVTVDNTSCIGMSDQAPALLVNGYTIPHLTHEKCEQIVDFIEKQIPVDEWSADLFQVSDNIQRRDLLLGQPFENGSAIKFCLDQGTDATLATIDQSGLRGCGGAGFKTATKWNFCRQAQADQRFVVCNADEGEPGTFKDRVLLQSYADLVFEGMTVCAYTIGAKQGFLYLRGEYRYLVKPLEAILAKRRQQGLLGNHILGNPNFNFDIQIYLGAGAYVCGAELALIESLEGKRGTPRNRPPFPVTHGYLNKPTVVNNVETFALAAKIPVYGAENFAAIGTKESKGTKLLSISGDCDKSGIYEIPFGMTIREILVLCGAQDTQAVQVSGPAGRCINATEFDHRICFEDIACGGSFMIFNQQRDLFEVVQNFAEFFVHESCGFCTPCRVGTSVLKRLLGKIQDGHGTADDLQEMTHLHQLLKTASHCGLGQTASNHIADTLQKFPQIYQQRLKVDTRFEPSFDLDNALEAARQITGRSDHLI